MSDRGQVQAAVARLRDAFGPVTIVVNNAGVTDFTPFEEITEELFDFIYKVNVLGPIIVTQETSPNTKRPVGPGSQHLLLQRPHGRQEDGG